MNLVALVFTVCALANAHACRVTHVMLDGGVLIVSAPSPVMGATDCVETHFYVHTLTVAANGRLDLLAPERVTVPGQASAENAAAT